MDSIQTFQHERISVITDSSGYVVLAAAGRTRVFGNVWASNDNIIFKGPFPLCSLYVFFSVSDSLLDLSGKLESESVVGASIQGTPNLRCFVQRWPSLDTTFTQITSAAGVLIPNWTEPIHQMLRSPGDRILITDNPSLWGSRIGTAAAIGKNLPCQPRIAREQIIGNGNNH